MEEFINNNPVNFDTDGVVIRCNVLAVENREEP